MDLSDDDTEIKPKTLMSDETQKVYMNNKLDNSMTDYTLNNDKQIKIEKKETFYEVSEEKKVEEDVGIEEKGEKNEYSSSVKSSSTVEATKIAASSVTKFLKKIDNKDAESDAQSYSSKSKVLKVDTSVEIESKDILMNFNAIKVYERKYVAESKKDETSDSDSEEDVEVLHNASSSSNKNETTDTSELQGTHNMNVDSDVDLDLDDRYDDNNDNSNRPDNDNNKTEHEDTDSNSRSTTKPITPAQNKLLELKGREREFTSKQLIKKLEMQKKVQMRDKQKQEKEKKFNLKMNELANKFIKVANKFIILSGIVKQVKGFGLPNFIKRIVKGSSYNELQNERINFGDAELTMTKIMIKIHAYDRWDFVMIILAYALDNRVPFVIIYNSDFRNASVEFTRFLNNNIVVKSFYFANQNSTNDSRIIIIYLNVNIERLVLTVDRSSRYRPVTCEQNNFLMLDIVMNGSQYQLITISSYSMSDNNETNLYLNLRNVLFRPTIMVVVSPMIDTGCRFHQANMDGEFLYELIADHKDLHIPGERTGRLIYISRNFPEPLRNANIQRTNINYLSRRRRQNAIQEVGSMIMIGMPLLL